MKRIITFFHGFCMALADSVPARNFRLYASAEFRYLSAIGGRGAAAVFFQLRGVVIVLHERGSRTADCYPPVVGSGAVNARKKLHVYVEFSCVFSVPAGFDNGCVKRYPGGWIRWIFSIAELSSRCSFNSFSAVAVYSSGGFVFSKPPYAISEDRETRTISGIPVSCQPESVYMGFKAVCFCFKSFAYLRSPFSRTRSVPDLVRNSVHAFRNGRHARRLLLGRS